MEFYSANGFFFLDKVAEAHTIKPTNAGWNNESKMPMRPSSCIQFLYILVQTKRLLKAEIGYPLRTVSMSGGSGCELWCYYVWSCYKILALNK